MSAELEFSGERFVPGVAGEIAHEHWHRYAFARRLVMGRKVLDVACGEGYGSALLATVAADVVGVDIAAAAVDHARASYGHLDNVRYEQGSAVELPLPDASVDRVVSFETIEHLPAVDQSRMLAEMARVLAPEGLLILSAPNPIEYSQARNYRNPFHLHEPSRAELDAALAPLFATRRWFLQRRYFGSALWSEEGGEAVEAWAGDAQGVDRAQPPAAMYFVVIAARGAWPADADELPAVSLFTDRDDVELARIDSRAAEVLRLDALLKDRDSALDRQTAHVRHLEDLVAQRERLVQERDQQLMTAREMHDALNAERTQLLEDRERAVTTTVRAVAAYQAESERLERAIGAQERIIAYRQSARWWLSLPWLRIRLWWKRVNGT
jgi:SAM-dependent methyltransferase